jgi:hypothetical protein
MNNLLRETTKTFRGKTSNGGRGISKQKIIRFEANKNKIDLQDFKEIKESQKGNQRGKMMRSLKQSEHGTHHFYQLLNINEG